MGKLLHISDYVSDWERLYIDDSGDTTLAIYVDTKTGRLDVSMYNDDGDVVRKELTTVESAVVINALSTAQRIKE